MTFSAPQHETWPEFLPGGCRPLKKSCSCLPARRRWPHFLLGAGAALWVLLFLRMADRLLFMVFDLAHRSGLSR